MALEVLDPTYCIIIVTVTITLVIRLITNHHFLSKNVQEPPLVKSNLERHLCHDKTFGAAFNKESSTYQKICFAIALFHSSVNERRGYSLCGWNQGIDDSKLSYLLFRL